MLFPLYSEFIPILTTKKKYIQQLIDGEEFSEEEHEMVVQENPKQIVHTLSSSDNDDEGDEEMIQSKNESQDNNVMDTSQDLFGDFE